MSTDTNELVNCRETTKKGKVAHLDMSGKRRIVGHDDRVADLTIVPDMASHHEEPVVAHPRRQPAARCTGVHGHVFADLVARTDFKIRNFAGKLEVLWLMSDRGKGPDTRSRTHPRMPRDSDMADEFDAIRQFYIGTDGTKRTWFLS